MSDGPNHSIGDGATRTRSGRAQRSSPNYAARRMLVGTVAVTLVFAAGVVGWRWLAGEDGSAGRERAGWSSIAFVDRTSGDVIYVDRDGEVIDESLGHGRTGSLYASGGVLALANSRTLTVLPETGSDDDPLDIALPDGGRVTPIPTPAGTYVALGTPTGGNVTIVDLAGRLVIDVGDLASGASATTPKMFVETLRTNDDATMFAIADAANFQTIVVQPDEPEPVFLADQPIAVGDDLVATSQTVGLQADIALVALDRSTKVAVPTPIPAGAVGVMTGDRLTMVSVDGGVFRIEPGDDDANRIGTVAVPTSAVIEWVRPTSRGERLVVGGATFEAVVDLDGRTLFTTTFPSAVEAVAADPLWRCLPIGGPDGFHSIIDLDTGEQLADLTGVERVLGTSADGCVVLAVRSDAAELIGPDGTAVIGTFESAVLGPDGASVVRVDADGTTELLTVDDDFELAEPVELTDLAPANALITFIPE